MAVSGAELDDLDLVALEAWVARRARPLRETGSLEDAAIRLGLLARSAPRVAPTAVGLLMFGRCPQWVQPDWGLGAVVIAGDSLADPVLDRADIEGNIPSMVTQALAFLRAGAEPAPSVGALPPTADEYSEAAVREALVNALVHRDLRRTGRVALRRFVDRIEVWSPGGLPEGASDISELLRTGGVSHPRNPILAAVARSMGIGEQLGRGLPVMSRAGAGFTRNVEIAATARDVLITLPSRWTRAQGPDAVLS